ncbi:glycosyltransferase family 4 protein, partial [Candidatus Parcubacteria bacterium]|nr:glycosyltransferase family 4 protein [Candidatus Parcubacteria bacterium]
RLPRGYDMCHISNHMLGRLARFVKPVVVTAHDVLQFKYREDMGNPVISKIYNYLMEQSIKSLRRADRIICVSDHSRSQVIKQLEVPGEKVVTVHNGLDHQLFKPLDQRAARQKLSLPPRAKVLLHVGSELRRKNVPGLLKAFVKVKERLGDVVLARVGEKTEGISKLTTEYKVTSDVVYFQNVSEAELPMIYTAADVLVMPSFDEGFGFPIIEAQACGTPVITSNCSSMPEVAGGAAILANPENPEDIADSILKVVGLSSARRENLVAAGIENARRFSWEKCARETLGVYKEVVK